MARGSESLAGCAKRLNKNCNMNMIIKYMNRNTDDGFTNNHHINKQMNNDNRIMINIMARTRQAQLGGAVESVAWTCSVQTSPKQALSQRYLIPNGAWSYDYCWPSPAIASGVTRGSKKCGMSPLFRKPSEPFVSNSWNIQQRRSWKRLRARICQGRIRWIDVTQ